jgi:hypothetical protein
MISQLITASAAGSPRSGLSRSDLVPWPTVTLEARAEEVKAAKALLRTQNEQFQPKLPEARSRRYRGTELVINRELEQMPDDLRPQHIIDDGSYGDAA